VRDNRAQIGPALANVTSVLDTLEANQANLDRSIALLAPFVRVFANTVGNGRWFDTYIQNIVPVPGGIASPR
jgi:phospholipid/cholesterol/gamma-HCH transport system substrate-binding protein